jgi:hypothetical protein
MRLREALSMLVVSVAVAVPAAAKDLAASLRGNWTVDKLAAIEAMAPPFYKSATPEKQKEIRDDMMKRMPDISVEFTATTAAMKSGQEAPQVATYKVIRSEKSTVWLDLLPQGKNGPAPQAEKYTMEFVDADTVKMLKEGEPTALLLKRQK